MCNGILATKKNEILEKDKYSIPYMQNLKKNDTNKSIYKITHRHRKQTYGCQWGRVRGKDKLGAWG